MKRLPRGKPRYRAARGLTLLEVIVAMTVLAIGILSVLAAFSSCLRASKSAQVYEVGAVLASQVASQLDRTSSLGPGEYSGDFGEGAPDYSWGAVVAEPDDHGLLQVDITVSWGPEARRSQYPLRTFLRPPTQQTAPTGA